MEKEKQLVICQSNALTESRYDFNRVEKNCIYKIIEKVRKVYVEPQELTPADGFENLAVTITGKDLNVVAERKEDAKEALRNLRGRTIELEDAKGNWLLAGFINYAEYHENSDSFEVEVSKKILPHIVELVRHYTPYDLTVAISLKSVYAQRFYELCCQYRNNIEIDGFAGFHKTQDQLRQMFCLEGKYVQNQDFNRKVVLKAQEDLKSAYEAGQCNLYFEVYIKGRGKGQSYDFKIYTREATEKQREAADELRKKFVLLQGKLLNTFTRDRKFVERVGHALDFSPEKIDPIYQKMLKLEKEYKGADFAKLLRWILKEDFQIE